MRMQRMMQVPFFDAAAGMQRLGKLADYTYGRSSGGGVALATGSIEPLESQHTIQYGVDEVVMNIVSIAATAVAVVTLLLLSSFHVYWGYGGAWPARSRTELGSMVVGATRGRAMPSLRASLVVAGLLLTAAALVAWSGFVPSAPWVPRVGSAGVLVVLTARGIVGFADGWLRPATRSQPFFRLNRLVYSPLCLALAGLIALELA
jgi:hypothetical protein